MFDGKDNSWNSLGTPKAICTSTSLLWVPPLFVNIQTQLVCWVCEHTFYDQVNLPWHLVPSLVCQRLKRLPAMWETWVQSLGREVPLEKEMAIHSCILAWRIPRTEEPGGLQFMGSQRVGHDWVTSLSLKLWPFRDPRSRDLISRSHFRRVVCSSTCPLMQSS